MVLCPHRLKQFSREDLLVGEHGKNGIHGQFSECVFYLYLNPMFLLLTCLALVKKCVSALIFPSPFMLTIFLKFLILKLFYGYNRSFSSESMSSFLSQFFSFVDLNSSSPLNDVACVKANTLSLCFIAAINDNNIGEEG